MKQLSPNHQQATESAAGGKEKQSPSPAKTGRSQSKATRSIEA